MGGPRTGKKSYMAGRCMVTARWLCVLVPVRSPNSPSLFSCCSFVQQAIESYMEDSDEKLRKAESDVLQSTMTITMLRQAVANMSGRLQSMNKLIEKHGVGACSFGMVQSASTLSHVPPFSCCVCAVEHMARSGTTLHSRGKQRASPSSEKTSSPPRSPAASTSPAARSGGRSAHRGLADVRQSLGYFDKDNTGKVDVSQISRILERLGSHKLSGSELEFVLQAVKAEGSSIIDEGGMVNLDAFSAWATYVGEIA